MKRLIPILCFCYSFGTAYAQKIDTFAVIGHSKIFYHQRGSEKPSVVFVSGLGEPSDTWSDVQDSISMFSKTISYDRSGLGKSEYHGERKDVKAIATELYRLTKAIRLQKPFILVGHSLGCEIIKEFAALFPLSVAGLIFIDPGYNEDNLKKILPDSIWQQRADMLKKYLPVFNPAQSAELGETNHSTAIADTITHLPNVPVFLFTATHVNPDFPGSAEEFKVKRDAHMLWLQSMPQAKHIETPLSRHYIQNDAPHLIIAAAQEMVEEIKKN